MRASLGATVTIPASKCGRPSVSVVVVDILLPPAVGYTYVYTHRKHDVERHPRHHHYQPLPRRFGPEFPRLGRRGHLLLVLALVDHARDLDVTAERHPTHAVNGVAYSLLPQREPRVEEQVEPLDPHPESPGEDEVPELVDENQKRETEYELNDLDYYFHLFLVVSDLRAKIRF